MARCEECIHEKVCLHRANIQTDTYAYMGVNYDTKSCKHFMPTADVAPKSEVERLEKELDSKQFRCDSCDRIMLTGAEHRYCVKQAKAEVARYIFEEIEKARKRWEVVYSDDHFGYGGGAYGYLESDVDHTIYELKKKYTGGENNGSKQ